MWDAANWRHWRMVVKLDPGKTLSAAALDIVIRCNPDAIMIGGTQGITLENSQELVDTVRQRGYTGKIVQEISDLRAIVAGVDAHFIPIVLNAGHVKWITGLHHEALLRYRGLIDWSRVIAEGYVICNPGSAAGKITGVSTVDDESVVAYGLLAGQLMGIPWLYIEYSGVFGEPLLVEKVSRECGRNLHIVYGGGIRNPSQARRMLELVDTIVIGNLVYENPEQLPEIFTETITD